MSTVGPAIVFGSVASLHLHPSESGTPMHSVPAFEVIEEKGIQGNKRYFGRRSRSTGKPTNRQVSLIEREQIAEHATALGLQTIVPGKVRANIETFGVKWTQLVGQQVKIGEAILEIAELRDPCSKMDEICNGLRELMDHGRQGVLARVVQSGRIRVGDTIMLAK